MRKYDTQYQCLDEHCRTVVVGNGKYMDGIRCPRCDGPVIPQPFTKKPSKLNVTVSVKDTELFIQLTKLLKDISESEEIPTNIKVLIQNRIGELIAGSE